MDHEGDEENQTSHGKRTVAIVLFLSVAAIVAVGVAARPDPAPVDVSTSGAPTNAGEVPAAAVTGSDLSPTTLAPITLSPTTSSTAVPSTTTSTVKAKSSTTSTTQASTSTTTTAPRPLPPSLLGKIVFSGTREGIGGIWEMDPDSGNPRNLTPVPGHNPDLSPDGRHLIWNSGPGSGDLMIMGSDGSDQRMLVPAISVYTPPSWSPDGRRIVYANSTGLRTISPDGTGDRVIFTPQRNQYNDGLNIYGVSWAPDGKRLVATSLGASSADGLWIIDLDRQSASHVYTGGAHEVAWSPLGDRIAFSGGSSNPVIFTIRPDGTDLKQLTGLAGQLDAGSTASDPAWSPDGSRIAFGLYQSGPAIWDIGADGSGLRNLTNGAGQDSQPTF